MSDNSGWIFSARMRAVAPRRVSGQRAGRRPLSLDASRRGHHGIAAVPAPPAPPSLGPLAAFVGNSAGHRRVERSRRLGVVGTKDGVEAVPRSFPSQTAAQGGTPRIPQDLGPFIASGTITQAILDDPNTVLRNAIAGLTIVSTTAISISTSPPPPAPRQPSAATGLPAGSHRRRNRGRTCAERADRGEGAREDRRERRCPGVQAGRRDRGTDADRNDGDIDGGKNDDRTQRPSGRGTVAR